jgi:hypothetical protein
MKLTLRDLLWLALLIASYTAGGMQHQRRAAQVEALKKTSFLRDLGAGPSPAALQRQATLKKLAARTDQELDLQFGILATSGQWIHAADYEPCLTEMVRRRMADSLQKHYDAQWPERSQSSISYNLELLTAFAPRDNPIRSKLKSRSATQRLCKSRVRHPW